MNIGDVQQLAYNLSETDDESFPSKHLVQY
jgi:hypothetical protein